MLFQVVAVSSRDGVDFEDVPWAGDTDDRRDWRWFCSLHPRAGPGDLFDPLTPVPGERIEWYVLMGGIWQRSADLRPPPPDCDPTEDQLDAPNRWLYLVG